MGEVYLGEDTRLGRKVAIKVLPEEYASDPERLARFEQEAKLLAGYEYLSLEILRLGPDRHHPRRLAQSHRQRLRTSRQ